MFGNFMQNFGLDFPLQQADAQGGLFGANAPQAGEPPLGGPAAPGGAGTGLNMTAPATGGPPPGPGGPLAAPGVITPPAATNPAGSGSAAPSPLASPLAPGGGASALQQPPPPADNPAPAAGVGSQFSGGQQGRF